MDKKDKIVEILESWEKDNGHYFNSISGSDYENIADEVLKLLKGRKSEAEIELSYCDLGTSQYTESKKTRDEEIEQIEKALLIISDFSDPVKEAYQQGFNDGATAAADSIAANPKRL